MGGRQEAPPARGAGQAHVSLSSLTLCQVEDIIENKFIKQASSSSLALFMVCLSPSDFLCLSLCLLVSLSPPHSLFLSPYLSLIYLAIFLLLLTLSPPTFSHSLYFSLSLSVTLSDSFSLILPPPPSFIATHSHRSTLSLPRNSLSSIGSIALSRRRAALSPIRSILFSARSSTCAICKFFDCFCLLSFSPALLLPSFFRCLLASALFA